MAETETHLSFDAIRKAAHHLADKRRQAVVDYGNHARKAADCEREYRKELAIAFTVHRSAGKPVGESELLGNRDAADKRHDRDIAQALAKADLLLIDALEREQATLRQLGEWSKELEVTG